MFIDFREEGRERNIDVREKHWLVASHMRPYQYWTQDLGIKPANLASRMTAQPSEPPGQGRDTFFLSLASRKLG